jgi:hypothetical protein
MKAKVTQYAVPEFTRAENKDCGSMPLVLVGDTYRHEEERGKLVFLYWGYLPSSRGPQAFLRTAESRYKLVQGCEHRPAYQEAVRRFSAPRVAFLAGAALAYHEPAHLYNDIVPVVQQYDDLLGELGMGDPAV